MNTGPSIRYHSSNGIKSVSIAEIAEKANVSQVSIYNFFEDKENLAKQAFFTFQLVFEKDPMVQKFLVEYGKNKTIPLLLELVEQGKRELSTESVLKKQRRRISLPY